MKTICIKHQILFSVENKKNINLLSAELAQRVVKVKLTIHSSLLHYIDQIYHHSYYILFSNIFLIAKLFSSVLIKVKISKQVTYFYLP